MPRVHRLPAELANQIAAGEVVERPASVVKELVENAIDADARRVSIAVEMGGKRLVRVEDDGTGMSPEDAELALERHATSKIGRAEDLAAIQTLGFRGEALPSIASVSHLLLRTRARGAPTGTEIRVNAGVVASVREVGAAEGTLMEAADLFYNLPARRKFLKSDVAETTQISRLVTQMALGYPEVGFTLTSGGRRLLESPPVADVGARFYQLYGERPDLVEVRRETAGVQVFGYVAALSEDGPTRGAQQVFVNRRIVRDKTIAHAIHAAYATATIKERSPEVFLFLDLPPERVDVNVHPTKAEVRFLDQSLVHEVLRRAIADALGRSAAPTLQFHLGQPSAVAPAEPTPRILPGVVSSGRMFGEGLDVTTGVEPREPVAIGDRGVSAGEAVRPMAPLGQFRDTYIIAVDDEGIAIVDQHVAHERVLFERVMERLASGRLAGQRLIAPLVIELAPGLRDALASHASELDRLGFELEAFGGSSVRIAAIPSLLGADQAVAAVKALAEDLEGLERGARVEQSLRQIAATTACHAAVKANQRLTREKMVHILDELHQTAYSSVCPHGRPVVLRLTRREIEKNFQRI